MTQDLQMLCKELRISGVDQYFIESGPHDPEVSAFLEAACQCEIDIRMMNRRLKTLKQAGFPTQKRFDDLILEKLPDDGRTAIPVLKQLEFVEQKRNVILIGNSGVGKTHLAIGLGIRAIENGYTVMYVNASVLIERMKEAYQLGQLEWYLKKLVKPKLLVVDEIGYLPFDSSAAYCFFQLISKRYEKVSTIFTSNKSFGEWGEIFQDQVIAAAILDRILHHCVTLNIKGESFRMKDRKKHKLNPNILN